MQENYLNGNTGNSKKKVEILQLQTNYKQYFCYFLVLLLCHMKSCPRVILRPLVHHVAHGSQLVLSPLILSSIFCCILMSSSVIQLWLSKQNMVSWCPASVGGWETKRVCVLFVVLSTLIHGYMPSRLHRGGLCFCGALESASGSHSAWLLQFLCLEKMNFLRFSLAWTMI